MEEVIKEEKTTVTMYLDFCDINEVNNLFEEWFYMKEIRMDGKLKKVIFTKEETKYILKPNMEAIKKRDAY